jgi:hypothetical protein
MDLRARDIFNKNTDIRHGSIVAILASLYTGFVENIWPLSVKRKRVTKKTVKNMQKNAVKPGVQVSSKP